MRKHVEKVRESYDVEWKSTSLSASNDMPFSLPMDA